jgi:hypothetical protein
VSDAAVASDTEKHCPCKQTFTTSSITGFRFFSKRVARAIVAIFLMASSSFLANNQMPHLSRCVAISHLEIDLGECGDNKKSFVHKKLLQNDPFGFLRFCEFGGLDL